MPNPVRVELPTDQRHGGQGEGHSPQGIAQKHDGRMNQHRRVLQQRTQARPLAHGRNAGFHRIGREDHHGRQKAQIAHQHAKDGLAQAARRTDFNPFVPERNEFRSTRAIRRAPRLRPPAVGQGQQAQEPSPQQERAGLTDPQRGKCVVPGKVLAGVLRNVRERKILAVQRPSQDDGHGRQAQDTHRGSPPSGEAHAAMLPRRAGWAGEGGEAGADEGGQQTDFTQDSHGLSDSATSAGGPPPERFALILASTPSQELIAPQSRPRLQSSFDHNVDVLGQVVGQRSRANDI